MCPRIKFQGRVSVPDLDNLGKVHPQECGDRTMLLVLMDMPQLVRQKPSVPMPATDEDGMSEGEACHSGAKQAGLQRGGSEDRIVRQRKGIHHLDANKLTLADADPQCYFLLRGRERITGLRRQPCARLCPRDRCRKKRGKRLPKVQSVRARRRGRAGAGRRPRG